MTEYKIVITDTGYKINFFDGKTLKASIEMSILPQLLEGMTAFNVTPGWLTFRTMVKITPIFKELEVPKWADLWTAVENVNESYVMLARDLIKETN